MIKKHIYYFTMSVMLLCLSTAVSCAKEQKSVKSSIPASFYTEIKDNFRDILEGSNLIYQENNLVYLIRKERGKFRLYKVIENKEIDRVKGQALQITEGLWLGRGKYVFTNMSKLEHDNGFIIENYQQFLEPLK